MRRFRSQCYRPLGELAGRAHPAIVDVTIQAQVQHVIEDAAARHGRIDSLFNNAGVGYTRPIANATLDHWRQLIDVNLWSVIYGVHAAIPIMRKQGGGHIVNTASFAGVVPLPFQALYCTTKYAVVGMSESLRFELADENIHFSVVCPGDVATRIYEAGLQGEQFQGKLPDDAIPASEAAQTILEGVARKEGIIVLPEAMRQLWTRYRASPESCEGNLLDLARGRRSAFKSTAS